MKVQIKQILNTEGNNFGDKAIIFVGDDGNTYLCVRCEGDHHELELNKYVNDSVRWINPCLNIYTR